MRLYYINISISLNPPFNSCQQIPALFFCKTTKMLSPSFPTNPPLDSILSDLKNNAIPF